MITNVQCRAARAWLNITQDELAVLCGLNRNSIHTWELGKSTMHLNNVAVVERVLTERGIRFLSDPPGIRASV